MLEAVQLTMYALTLVIAIEWLEVFFFLRQRNAAAAIQEHFLSP